MSRLLSPLGVANRNPDLLLIIAWLLYAPLRLLLSHLFPALDDRLPWFNFPDTTSEDPWWAQKYIGGFGDGG